MGKFGLGVQNEAGQRLSEFYQENALVTSNTVFQKHKRNSTHGHHQVVNTKIRLIILFSQRWKSSIQSAKIRLGADCGLDNELIIAKFRLKWKKVGKTTKPFRYDLNQIPYDYVVEVINRCKRLDLVDRMREELWPEVHNIV